MRMRTIAAVAGILGLVGSAHSEETATSRPKEEANRPVRSIRVLQNPYDLASYYSSRPGRSSPTPPVPDDPAYALASFYRSRQIGPPPGAPPGPWLWAAFWARGYGAPCPTPFVGYRHSIGENGDLFLAVPFLAPVGPLNGIFP
ncbi:MAG: hypothetical protein LJF15_18200 [Acidobacteria bacterium]|nr:hypothetical protein [Acidobacteriota bacterium]